MIDFHSHVLPGVDDGSANVVESIELLKRLKEQGIHTVVATPHFYADNETVDNFLKRRDASAELLLSKYPNDYPSIVCGAEVSYYSGISRLSDLQKLCIGSSKLLLMEMSMSKWTDYMLNELVELSSRGDIRIVLAHVERYMSFQSADTMRRLRQNGVLMQCNASMFNKLGTKRKAIAMLQNGEIHFIGSDCHNLTSRSPCIGKAYDIIRNKCGEQFLSQLCNYGSRKLTMQ